jgi:hypothetical protein
MSSYKGFTLNDPSTAAPWGARELQAMEDIIDTLCVGTVAATKDAANGHQHLKLTSVVGTNMFEVDSTSRGANIYTDGTGSAFLRFKINAGDSAIMGIQISTNNTMTINNPNGGIVISPVNQKITLSVPTSSSGLTAGMIYSSSGTLKIV